MADINSKRLRSAQNLVRMLKRQPPTKRKLDQLRRAEEHLERCRKEFLQLPPPMGDPNYQKLLQRREEEKLAAEAAEAGISPDENDAEP